MVPLPSDPSTDVFAGPFRPHLLPNGSFPYDVRGGLRGRGLGPAQAVPHGAHRQQRGLPGGAAGRRAVLAGCPGKHPPGSRLYVRLLRLCAGEYPVNLCARRRSWSLSGCRRSSSWPSDVATSWAPTTCPRTSAPWPAGSRLWGPPAGAEQGGRTPTPCCAQAQRPRTKLGVFLPADCSCSCFIGMLAVPGHGSCKQHLRRGADTDRRGAQGPILRPACVARLQRNLHAARCTGCQYLYVFAGSAAA